MWGEVSGESNRDGWQWIEESGWVNGMRGDQVIDRVLAFPSSDDSIK